MTDLVRPGPPPFNYNRPIWQGRSIITRVSQKLCRLYCNFKTALAGRIWASIRGIAFIKQAIAFISPGIEPTVCASVLDRAIRLVTMGAVGESAAIDERPQIAEEPGHLGRDNIPQLELTDPRRIDYVTRACGEPQKPSSRGSVLAFFGLLAHGGHTQVETWFNCVQKRSFADPALADNDASAAIEIAPQHIDAAARRGRSQEHRVTHAAINADQRLQIDGLNEVDLVDADDRPQLAFFGADQEPVDESRLQSRLRGAGNDHHLIDIGHDHVLLAAHRAA